jgi:hypothetical protein
MDHALAVSGLTKLSNSHATSTCMHEIANEDSGEGVTRNSIPVTHMPVASCASCAADVHLDCSSTVQERDLNDSDKLLGLRWSLSGYKQKQNKLNIPVQD